MPTLVQRHRDPARRQVRERLFDVGPQPGTDELIEHLLPQLGVRAQQLGDGHHEEKQQREQAEEPVVGDQRR